MRRRAEASHRLHNSRGSDGRSIACLAERAAHSRSRTSQCGLSSLFRRKRRCFSPLPTCMPPSPQLLKSPPQSRVSCSILFFLLFHFFILPRSSYRDPLKKKKKNLPLSVFFFSLSQTRHTFDILFNFFLSRLLKRSHAHIDTAPLPPPSCACPVARLKQLKPGEIRGEPGHALMACEGRGLSFCSAAGQSEKQTVAISGMSSFIHAC